VRIYAISKQPIGHKWACADLISTFSGSPKYPDSQGMIKRSAAHYTFKNTVSLSPFRYRSKWLASALAF
jgi:hypothetical protein